jgi:hypothetical protein
MSTYLPLALLLASGCNSTTAPTNPAPKGLIGIAVQPNSVSLHIGMTANLIAIGQYANAHTEPIRVAWSTSSPGVVQIDNSGALRATGIGAATITAISSPFTATANVTVSGTPEGTWPDFSGTWSGDSLELNCNWLGGPGPSPCEGHYNGGAKLSTLLSIHEAADAVTCEVTIGGINKFLGTLVGSIDRAGHLHLTGAVSGEEVGVAVVESADLSLSSAATLVGTFTWTNTFTNGFGVQKLHEDWRLLDLVRSP